MDAILPTSEVKTGLNALSAREREVLVMIAAGMRTDEIARKLHRSVPTIKSHRQQLGKKLGVRSRVDLARIAIQEGLISLDGQGEASTVDLAAVLSALCTPMGRGGLQHLADNLARAIQAKALVIGQIAGGRVQPVVAFGMPTPQGAGFTGGPLAQVDANGWFNVDRSATSAMLNGTARSMPTGAECAWGMVSPGTPQVAIIAFSRDAAPDDANLRLAMSAAAAHARALMQQSGAPQS